MPEWRVARSLDVLLGQLNARFPNRSKASDGSIGDRAHAARISDHNPDSGGVVRARDYTHDPKAGVDIDRLSDELAASRDPRIKYVIANNQIMSGNAGPNPWRWVAYSGSNPHTKHLHLSVVADSRADDPRPWALPMLALEATMPGCADEPITNFHGQRHSLGVVVSATEGRVASAQTRLERVEAKLDALPAQLRAAVAEGLVDVTITVRDKTT